MKKVFVLLTTAVLALSLVACSSGSSDAATSTKKISVAASPTPHAEILEKAKDLLAKEGWELEIREFEDYVQPIEVVESGEIDANYFAHTPYINNYNDEHGTKEVVVGAIHYEPYGIYPGKKASLDELSSGDEILIPNDGTNETRALLLLQDNGVINLPAGTDATSLVTVKDIESYNVDVNITEIEAAQISHRINEVAVVVLNGNYALAAGLSVAKDSIAFESAESSAATTYANVVVVKEGNENNEGILALVKVLQSDEIKDFINEKWDGSVIPAK